jgi:outer membrane protein
MKVLGGRCIQALPARRSSVRKPAHRCRPACAWVLVPLLPLLASAPSAGQPLSWASARSSAAPVSPPAAPGLGLLDSVRLMLANDPNLVLARSHLLSAAGALAIQTGMFDTVVTGSVGYLDTRTPALQAPADRQTALTVSAGVAQELRSGLTLSPAVELSSGTANSALTGLPGPPAIVNTATVAFTLRQPLLRGRGSKAVAAGERAARREAEASALDLRFTTAQRILTVATQYWTAVAARLSLEILRSNEETSHQLLTTTRRLIEADITAPAEAVQLEANLAAAEASRLAGENALFKACQDLGRELGLDGARVMALPPPSDPMPELAPITLDGLERARFVAGALRLRADVAAARKRLEETAALLDASENALLPQLDLVLRPSYSGLMGGGGLAAFLASLANQIPGVSSSLSLDLSWPVRNDAAQGRLLQARAGLQQSTALLDQLQNNIGADVPTAVDTVVHTARQVAQAKEAVRLFERAVANEERKLSAGSSTVLDVITQRDRLLAARQTEVSAKLSLAVALAQLRFDTGTILAESGELEIVDYPRLTTVPAAEEMSH